MDTGITNRLDQNSLAPQTYKAYLRQQAQDQLKQFQNQTQSSATIDFPVTPLVQDAPIPLQIPQNIIDSFKTLLANGNNEDIIEGPNMPITGHQNTILSKPAPLTQPFGNMNPADEVFSGGVNTGADFGAQPGTAVALPPGKWKIVSAFGQARGNGYIGNNTNSGYGNSILAQNTQTGEKLRFSHLSRVGVNQGQTINGGNIIGLTGATGNVTGPHLDLEYYTPQGNVADILRSAYARYLANGQ